MRIFRTVLRYRRHRIVIPRRLLRNWCSRASVNWRPRCIVGHHRPDAAIRKKVNKQFTQFGIAIKQDTSPEAPPCSLAPVGHLPSHLNAGGGFPLQWNARTANDATALPGPEPMAPVYPEVLHAEVVCQVVHARDADALHDYTLAHGVTVVRPERDQEYKDRGSEAVSSDLPSHAIARGLSGAATSGVLGSGGRALEISILSEPAYTLR